MIRFHSGYLIYVLLVVFCACSRDKLPVIEEDCIDEVSYDVQVESIINTTCSYSGCHDGSGAAPGNYTFYDGIEPFFGPDAFELRVLQVLDMPPSYATGPTSLTADEIEMLRCWVDNEYMK